MKALLAVMVMGCTLLAQDARAETSRVAFAPGNTIDSSELGPALSVDAMGCQTGRQGVQIDEMNNVLNSTESTAAVSGNQLNSQSTGMNNVSDNAFGTTSGVATIIQNTGNQNVIQSSFILNLSVR